MNWLASIALILVLGFIGAEDYKDRMAEFERTAEIIKQAKAEREAKMRYYEQRLKYMTSYDRIASK